MVRIVMRRVYLNIVAQGQHRRRGVDHQLLGAADAQVQMHQNHLHYNAVVALAEAKCEGQVGKMITVTYHI